MNLIHFVGFGPDAKAYVQMLAWQGGYNTVFTNLMAVDKDGRTWFVPSAKVERTETHSSQYPINYSVTVLILEAHGVVRRQSEI